MFTTHVEAKCSGVCRDNVCKWIKSVKILINAVAAAHESLPIT